MAFGSVNTPGAAYLDLEARLETENADRGQPGGVATLDADGRVPAAQLPPSMPASDVAAWAKAPQKPAYTPSEVGAAPLGHTHTAAQVGAKVSTWSAFYAGPSAPPDTTQLWIDTDPDNGGLKYWNGSAWATVPVAYT